MRFSLSAELAISTTPAADSSKMVVIATIFLAISSLVTDCSSLAEALSADGQVYDRRRHRLPAPHCVRSR